MQKDYIFNHRNFLKDKKNLIIYNDTLDSICECLKIELSRKESYTSNEIIAILNFHINDDKYDIEKDVI